MKADEPRPPVVKYGMATDETQRLVARHFAVTEEQLQIGAAILDHNLRIACIAHALLNANPADEPLPVAVEHAVAPSSVSVVSLATVRAELGLG